MNKFESLSSAMIKKIISNIQINFHDNKYDIPLQKNVLMILKTGSPGNINFH